MSAVPYLEAALLLLALTLDTFVACFAYGSRRIQIPPLSALTINLVCTATLGLALLLGSLLRPLIPAGLAQGLSFALLFLLGLIKLGDSSLKVFIRKHQNYHKRFVFRALHFNFILRVYADPEDADRDASQTLSAAEAVALAAALSLDGLAVGFGAALATVRIPLLLLGSLLTHLLAIHGGAWAGAQLARRLKADLSWLSGLLLMLLAVLRLV